MSERSLDPRRSLTADHDQPLIGVVAQEDGRSVVRYFTDDQSAEATSVSVSIKRALTLLGAWSDLDWEAAEAELDRIRHAPPDLTVKRYLLDTSVLAAGLFGRPGAVQLLTPWIVERQAATSIVVYGETVEYLRGLPNFPARRAELRELLRESSPYF